MGKVRGQVRGRRERGEVKNEGREERETLEFCGKV